MPNAIVVYVDLNTNDTELHFVHTLASEICKLSD